MTCWFEPGTACLGDSHRERGGEERGEVCCYCGESGGCVCVLWSVRANEDGNLSGDGETKRKRMNNGQEVETTVGRGSDV